MSVPLSQLAIFAPEPLPNPRAGRIFIKHRQRMQRLFTDRITHVVAQRAYCRIHTLDGNYTISVSLASLERQLPPCNLLRVHRSYLANVLHVELIGKRSIQVAGHELPLSQARRKELLSCLNTIA